MELQLSQRSAMRAIAAKQQTFGQIPTWMLLVGGAAAAYLIISKFRK